MIGTLVFASVAPDFDFFLGINHRGPTHSLGFALGLGLLVGLVMQLVHHRRAALIGALAALAVVTHILLDLLTAHAPVAALWPLSRREYALPFLVLPMAPTGDDLVSTRGLLLVGAELAWSVAIIVLAGWRSRVALRDPGPNQVR